ncbi:restriction endonuclease subunit S [Acinetobacter baumannii]|uniref:restriction endonuclease subunit S n=1 Tax=Acinetobacter baumannii TaxID=470 RepID=UPI0026EC03B9|nr:restriction endonuclease subunit S [Acinetobacter baumannii]MDO6889963.1 restriction endonuclease subunit S [Acinetobacter baumannii]MDO6908252.1 restriction endonuclease subunit S [Acinetobacter baumannii]MDO6920352.1 restriction endonuclease subunit S [Acinetobacter baumannii]MDO6923883.1 restriction endonuclease subunit S [Acinetobacter baumannii]MDO6926844.1 restriction endonuclease subunit S [Acinetobacter baumannii]
MAAPKLRFKEFDGDWNKNTIGNYVLNYKGGASLTPADFVEYSDCEVIPKKAISSGGLLQLDKVVPTFCTLEFFNSNQNYIVDSEYLITTLRDLVPSGPSIGYIVKYESNKKYILAQGVYGFRIKNDLNRDFLIQFSNTSKFRLHMQSIMVGSTQVHIRNQDYFSTELYTPSLLEQTKIASFLSTVDEKISQLTQKHELLSQYKQGMMQKLFSQQIRFKADDGSEFGEWEEVALSKVSDVRDGTHDSPSYVKDGYPLITSKNLKNGKLDLTDINLISEDDYLNINKRSAVNIGDIIFGMIGTIGNPVLLNSDGFAIKNVALIKEKDELLNIYLIHYLNSSFFAKQVALLNAGNTQKFLALGQIRSLSIHKPQLAEQTKIANFLSSIDQKIEVVAQQIEQAKQWKKGLLQQMFV